jgi:hypothetical protein
MMQSCFGNATDNFAPCSTDVLTAWGAMVTSLVKGWIGSLQVLYPQHPMHWSRGGSAAYRYCTHNTLCTGQGLDRQPTGTVPTTHYALVKGWIGSPQVLYPQHTMHWSRVGSAAHRYCTHNTLCTGQGVDRQPTGTVPTTHYALVKGWIGSLQVLYPQHPMHWSRGGSAAHRYCTHNTLCTGQGVDRQPTGTVPTTHYQIGMHWVLTVPTLYCSHCAHYTLYAVLTTRCTHYTLQAKSSGHAAFLSACYFHCGSHPTFSVVRGGLNGTGINQWSYSTAGINQCTYSIAGINQCTCSIAVVNQCTYSIAVMNQCSMTVLQVCVCITRFVHLPFVDLALLSRVAAQTINV